MIFSVLEKREQPEKHTKYKTIIQGSSTTKSKQEVDYEYYMCDNCKTNFRASSKNKWHEKEGGILEYPITSFKSIKLAICNKCLKETLKELDKHYRGW